jgi:hypothetical protein
MVEPLMFFSYASHAVQCLAGRLSQWQGRTAFFPLPSPSGALCLAACGPCGLVSGAFRDLDQTWFNTSSGWIARQELRNVINISILFRTWKDMLFQWGTKDSLSEKVFSLWTPRAYASCLPQLCGLRPTTNVMKKCKTTRLPEQQSSSPVSHGMLVVHLSVYTSTLTLCIILRIHTS